MGTIRGLRSACLSCGGNVVYTGTALICSSCFRKEDISRISLKQRAVLESKLEDIPVDIINKLSQAGKQLLNKSPDLVKAVSLLEKFNTTGEVPDEEMLLLKEAGFVISYGSVEANDRET